MAIASIILMFFSLGALFQLISGFLTEAMNINDDTAAVIETGFEIAAEIVSSVLVCFILRDYNINIAKCVSLRRVNIIYLLVILIEMMALKDLAMQAAVLLLSGKIHVIYSNSGYNMAILQGICTIFFAPIAEEIVFRFGCVELLREKTKPWIAIIVPSLIFTLFHGYNPQGFMSVFVVSLVTTGLFYQTNNLIYSIICHITFNAAAFLMDYSKIKLHSIPAASLKNGYIFFANWWIIAQLIILFFCFLLTCLIILSKHKKSSII